MRSEVERFLKKLKVLSPVSLSASLFGYNALEVERFLKKLKVLYTFAAPLMFEVDVDVYSFFITLFVFSAVKL